MKTHSMIPVSRINKLNTLQAEGIIQANSGPDQKKHFLRDIFRSHFDDYISQTPVSYHTEKIVRAIMACGTGELGYTLYTCQKCGKLQMSADKCGCRYCCNCGYLRQLQWVEARKAEVIEDLPYYHVIFTIPHELNGLIFQNQKLLLNNLFQSASGTILQLCAEKRKMIPGIVMVLHTFSSSMTLHYHIHMLVSGGGLTLDKTGFRPCRSKYLLPVQTVSGRYRSLFLQVLKDLHDAGRLEYFSDAQKYRNSYEWKELLDTCYAKEWNVEIKYLAPLSSSTRRSPVETFSRYTDRNFVTDDRIKEVTEAVPPAPDDAHEEDVSDAYGYFSNYIDRSAINDNRIRSWDAGSVSFEYKDYRCGGEKKVMTVSTHEFMRRFLLHILPPGVSKVRYAGFLAGCVKKKNLALIRSILKQEPPADLTKEMTASELAEYFYGSDLLICPDCHERLISAGHRMSAEHVAGVVRGFSPRAS